MSKSKIASAQVVPTKNNITYLDDYRRTKCQQRANNFVSAKEIQRKAIREEREKRAADRARSKRKLRNH